MVARDDEYDSAEDTPATPYGTPPPLTHLNVFMGAVVDADRGSFLFDSGASVSGVRSTDHLFRVQPCDQNITPAFGPQFKATTKGYINDPILSSMGIPALHVPMHRNLLSVTSVCAGGVHGKQHVGIFTAEGCRFYDLEANRDILKALSARPVTLQGIAENGVYVYNPPVSGRHTD